MIVERTTMPESNEKPVLSNAERQSRFRAQKALKGLPPDVQHTIDIMARDRKTGDVDEAYMAARIERATAYQRMYPEGYQPDGAGELCRVCGGLMRPLEQPRVYPSMCYACVMDKYKVA